MTHSTPFHALHDLELGDIVTLPDGKPQTVRSIERRLERTVGVMAGFILAGEIGPSCTLMSLPPTPGDEVVLYTPLDEIPSNVGAPKVAVEGVSSYWAPHLPNFSGAMAELGYKVCTIRGARDVLVILWRGRERVIFVKSAITTPDAIGMERMKRDAAQTEHEVARYAAIVRDSSTRKATHLEPVRKLPVEGKPKRRIKLPLRRG